MTQATNQLADSIKAAWRVSVPLVAINTADPAETMRVVVAAIPASVSAAPTLADEPAKAHETSIVQWDVVGGFAVVVPGDVHEQAVGLLRGEFDESKGNPIACLTSALKLPERSLLFVHLANRWVENSSVVQAAWNLRDKFKSNHRMVVFLGPGLSLPAELQHDVVVIDEPLPNPEQLAGVVRKIHACASLTVDDDTVERCVEATQGLTAFAAEQVVAMSLKKTGADVEALWERKRQQIEQTPGLKVFRGDESFEGIGGCRVVKDFLTKLLRHDSPARPNAIVFIDEIEKMLGGTRGDTSGVSLDQLGAILSYMQDHACTGLIFVGPPGTAKSAIAKSAGRFAGVPTIQLDLGAAKGSLVGQSEQQVRTSLKVITAVSNSRSLWIATCNGLADLPPELRRRFTLGTWFFDLPDQEERAAIWQIYAKDLASRAASATGLVDSRPGADAARLAVPSDDGWTGAEIKQCCDLAWRMGSTLREAAAFVVPVSKSAAEQIDKLRFAAEGKLLSASHPGVVRRVQSPAATTDSRRISVE